MWYNEGQVAQPLGIRNVRLTFNFQRSTFKFNDGVIIGLNDVNEQADIRICSLAPGGRAGDCFCIWAGNYEEGNLWRFCAQVWPSGRGRSPFCRGAAAHQDMGMDNLHTAFSDICLALLRSGSISG